MIQFTTYQDGEPGGQCAVNPEEVAAIMPCSYHSYNYRSSIATIILRSGEKIKVYQTVDEVLKRLEKK